MKLASGWIAILTLALSTSALSAHAAEVRYRLTLLDPSLDASTQVTEMNDRGEVIGNDGTGRAFLWGNGKLVDLGSLLDPQSAVSRAVGLNNRSDIVGSYQDGQGVTRQFLLQQGQVVPVVAIAGQPAILADINNRGQVLGSVSDAQFHEHLFIWRRGEAELLDPLPGGSNVGATAINDRAVVAGISDSPEGFRATIWRKGAAIAIAPVETRAVDINDRGQVLVEPDSLPGDGFVWEEGMLSPLPPLAGSDRGIIVRDINNRGVVVGSTSLPDGTGSATLWRNRTPIDLNTRIAADDPLRPFVRLAAAFLINDRGQIVALGPDSRQPGASFQLYLLDPVH
jgi:probable HAF family extracellular repeat protein